MARCATVAFAALAAADALLAATGHDRPRWLTKPLLMPVLMAGRDRPAQRALALGAAGDVALLGRGEAAFTAGLVSFLAGHVAWIVALRQRPGAARRVTDGANRQRRGDLGRHLSRRDRAGSGKRTVVGRCGAGFPWRVWR